MGAVGLHEMGISGVFLKPVDPAVVIQALRTRLGSGQRIPEPSGSGHA
jgi:hypothetical protein